MITQVQIISKSEELPQMECRNFFHSVEMFKIVEKTPRHKPFMVIARRKDGSVAAHMFACTRRHHSWIPPYLITQGRIYGEGEYDDDVDKDEMFAEMLECITKTFKRKLCLYTEFSDISTKMFGYKHFRANDYFPVNWQEVHNSLHSMAPEKRLDDKVAEEIRKAQEAGVITREVENEEELHRFYKLLKNFYRMKIRRFLPPEEMYATLSQSDNARIFITIYKEKIIGGCACLYSDGNAFLWYIATRRKTYAHVYPETITMWHAIQHAYEHHYAHINFLDVGLPYKSNKFRKFILNFGGKPVAKYRWFRFTLPWVNDLCSWFFNK
ncbi:MAG: GNAT family N-acetyltransferase [Prevotella sp.]|nr:GNAT family N-acetyltransferase [Prevotella sp.]